MINNGETLKIIAADSSAAVLNEKFEPVSIVAAAAVLVNSPYREADAVIAEPIFADAQNGQNVIVHEAELCGPNRKSGSRRCASGHVIRGVPT